jgi:hypothetical protein
MFPKRLHPAPPSQRSGRRRPGWAARPLLRPATAALATAAAAAAAALATPAILAAMAPVTAAIAVTAVAPIASRAPEASPARPVLAWHTAAPPTASPPLAYASEAYDPDPPTQGIVLFGGRTAAGTLSDTTWVWNGSTWRKPNTAEPPARELASMAFDPTLHKLILFGGQAADGTLLDDTWAWNGASWVQLSSTSPSPSSREAASFAYDQSGNLLLFGGTGYQPGLGGSPPSTTSTTNTSLGTQSPAAPAETTLGDTWQWTAGGWVQASVSGPSARSGATLAYDSKYRTDVLFGGESTPVSTGEPKPLADTWVWNGSKWTQAKPATSPPARFGAVADDDPPAGGPLLVCGQGISGNLADGWVWSGTGWIQASVQGSHSSRAGAAGAFDAATSSLVVFGGIAGGGGTLGDTGLVSLVPALVGPTTVPAVTTTTVAHPAGTVAPGTGHAGTTPSTIPKARTTPTTGDTTPATAVTPAPAPTGTLLVETSSSTVHRGAALMVAGSGFAPDSNVQLTFHSSPSLLGWATANNVGRFAKRVSIPAHAAAGEHHIVADGTTSSGAPTQLTTAVFVVLPHHTAISTATTLFLVGLALLIPVAAWSAMAGLGWRRRRRSAQT